MLALLLLLATASAQAQPERVGTLFYSPAERAGIVAARRADQPGLTFSSTRVSLGGLVKRGRGKSTAWVNGQAVAEGQAVPAAGVPVISAKSVAIDDQPVRVRETLDLESGSVSDVLPPGAFSVRRPK